MSDARDVSLTVGGMDYGGWKDVRISAGIERQARDFSVGITWKWPGSGDRPRMIHAGDRCEVRIGAELVLTGFVDATPVRWDSKQISVSVSGRSLTEDLVDCGAENKPGQWRNQSVLNIVRALASPYGIQVVAEADAGGVLTDHTIQPGETVFESIDRLLRLSRLLSTDDASGRLVIARPGSAGRAADRLERGINLLSGDAALNFSEVFSEYVSKGQRAGTDEAFGIEASEVEARATDTRITRKRVMVMHEGKQITPELARQRVAWERENRISKALATSYEVQGWRQSNGALWRHNQIVRVVDPLIGFDRDMLITAIDYTETNEGGTKAKLSVAPPDGFEAEPPDPSRRKLKKRKKGDDFEYLLPADWEGK